MLFGRSVGCHRALPAQASSNARSNSTAEPTPTRSAEGEVRTACGSSAPETGALGSGPRTAGGSSGHCRRHILKVLLVLSVGQTWTRVVAYSPE